MLPLAQWRNAAGAAGGFALSGSAMLTVLIETSNDQDRLPPTLASLVASLPRAAMRPISPSLEDVYITRLTETHS